MASEEFTEHLSRQVVAQTAVALGCGNAEPEVLEGLAEAYRAYLRRVSLALKERVGHAGRTAPTLLDAAAAAQAVAPAPVSWKTLQHFAFGNLRDPTRNEGETWEQPFVFDVPPFPLRKRQRRHYGGEAAEDEAAAAVGGPRRGGGLVPGHLPPFPPRRTYEDASRKGKTKSRGDARAVMAERRRRNRLVRRSLVKIVQVEDTETKETQAANGDAAPMNGDAAHPRSDVPLPKPLQELPALKPKPVDPGDKAAVPEHKQFDPEFRSFTPEEKLLFLATYEPKQPENERKKRN